jgi:SpoVK/Ycf46/Vps4 family AAA+-type ATPase
MYTEIIKIIEGGLNKDTKKVKSYAELLVKNLKSPEYDKFRKRIMDTIANNKPSSLSSLNGILSHPLDMDTNLSIVDVILPNDIDVKLVLPKEVEKDIERFIRTINNRDALEKSGIESNLSILLHGPPGCGKTSIAKLIAKRSNLPLVVARFDAVISSLLGSTAKNLRKIFEYADSFPCILFIDEFDAIAKARDDQHELGELKRVINSLLQNIDRFTQKNILIAATNHSDILDKAIWRRFDSIIKLTMPTSKSEISRIIELHLEGFGATILQEKKKMDILIELLTPYSPSDIRTICKSAIRNSIIDAEKDVTFYTLLEQIYKNTNQHDIESDKYICFLYRNGVPQTEISSMTNTSLRKVKSLIKEI